MPKGCAYTPPDPEFAAARLARLGWMHGALAFVIRDAFKANA